MASVAEGDREDIDRAVEAARRAFDGPWRRAKPFERQNLLLRLADLVEQNFAELAALDTLDMGAPISRTKGSRLRALTATIWKIGPAIATGCTVVLKPAEEAPLTPLRLAEPPSPAVTSPARRSFSPRRPT